MIPSLENKRLYVNPVNEGLNRSIEVSITVIGLIFLSPLLILLAAIVKISSTGPVFFKQKRVGQFGKNFVLYKFRTMRVNNEGPKITVKRDNRITWIGAVLRKTKFDELPALWNIIRGDMSIVGPRPEVPEYVSPENETWKQVLRVRPGITDPVTLRLRNEEEMLAGVTDPEKYYLDVLQPEKLNGYLQYINARSWKSDLLVIRDTLIAIVFPFEAPPPTVEKQSVGNLEQSEKNALILKLKFDRTRFLIDPVVLVTAFIFSYLLRFDFVVPERLLWEAVLQMFAVVLIQYAVIHISGISDIVWRYISLAELGLFVRAAIVSALPIVLFRIAGFSFLPELQVPLSIIFMDTIYAFGGLMGVRILRRVMYERYEKRQISAKNLSKRREPVFLIGAGRAGQLIAREIMGRGDSNFEIVGFIDDDPAKHGKVIYGVKVFGKTHDLPKLSNELAIKNVILAISNAGEDDFQRIIGICEKAQLSLKIMPGIYTLLDEPNLNGKPLSLEI